MTTKEKIKYFDSFSGIGGFTLAIHDVFPNAECVGFSEIDKYAKSVYLRHFPTHKDYGDITQIEIEKLPDFYLLVGGSPCQDLSIAKKNREGLSGSRSGLFYKFVEILKIKKPKHFILENVASMKREWKELILKTVQEIYPDAYMIEINAALVSAQNRKRVFFTNIQGIEQPKDRGIFLKDILEKSVDEKYNISAQMLETFSKSSGKNASFAPMKPREENEKAVTLTARYYKMGRSDNYIKRIGHLNKGGQGDSMIMQNYEIRKLTPTECARLQCFPDNWCEEISNSQQYKCYGNAVNTEVVKHIISYL